MCTASGCDKRSRRRNSRFCSSHEHRQQRYGNPLAGPRAPYGLPPDVRFWHYIDKTSSLKGCWLWKDGGRNQDGYVLFEIRNKPGDRQSMLAHRYAWFLKYGNEPSETLDHTCYVRHCVNPEHMVEMTLEKNKREGVERRSLERLAFEWLLIQHDGDYAKLKGFLLTPDYDKIVVAR